jgi:hypothetical protein
VRRAVKEAITNQGECLPYRSVSDRLGERHLGLEKIVSELSKVRSLVIDKETLTSRLAEILKDPFAASIILAAVKLDEDVARGLVPPKLGETDMLAKRFGSLFASKPVKKAELEPVNLPPFLRAVLVALLKKAVSGEKTESLK